MPGFSWAYFLCKVEKFQLKWKFGDGNNFACEQSMIFCRTKVDNFDVNLKIKANWRKCPSFHGLIFFDKSRNFNSSKNFAFKPILKMSKMWFFLSTNCWQFYGVEPNEIGGWQEKFIYCFWSLHSKEWSHSENLKSNAYQCKMCIFLLPFVA